MMGAQCEWYRHLGDGGGSLALRRHCPGPLRFCEPDAGRKFLRRQYLILLDTTLLVYFLPYVYPFAAYAVIRSRGDAEKSDFLKSRMAATLTGVAGLVTTVIAMAMALVPPKETASVWLFEAKVIGGFLAFVVVGAVLYWVGTRRDTEP